LHPAAEDERAAEWASCLGLGEVVAGAASLSGFIFFPLLQSEGMCTLGNLGVVERESIEQ